MSRLIVNHFLITVDLINQFNWPNCGSILNSSSICLHFSAILIMFDPMPIIIHACQLRSQRISRILTFLKQDRQITPYPSIIDNFGDQSRNVMFCRISSLVIELQTIVLIMRLFSLLFPFLDFVDLLSIYWSGVFPIFSWLTLYVLLLRIAFLCYSFI